MGHVLEVLRSNRFDGVAVGISFARIIQSTSAAMETVTGFVMRVL